MHRHTDLGSNAANLALHLDTSKIQDASYLNSICNNNKKCLIPASDCLNCLCMHEFMSSSHTCQSLVHYSPFTEAGIETYTCEEIC